MSEFFKPWRRKFGLLTLVMACLFMAMWCRSLFRIEYIEGPFGNSAIGMMSMHGGLDFYRITGFSNKPVLSKIQCKSVKIVVDPHDPAITTPWGPQFEFAWRRDWAGFHLGEGSYPDRRDQDCMIPYWSIILTFTLLSAWLLLGKSQQSTSKKITEPKPGVRA